MLSFYLIFSYLFASTHADEGETSLFRILNDAFTFLQNGDYQSTSDIFKKYFPVYSDDENFQAKYFDFLLKTGEYEEITKLKSNKSFSNNYAKTQIKNAEEYIAKRRSRDLTKVLELVKISPRSFDLLLLAAELCLNNNRKSDALKYIIMANNIKAEQQKYFEVMGRYKLMIKQYSAGIRLLKRNSRLAMKASDFESLYDEFNNFKSATFYNLQERLRLLNELSLKILRNKLKDNFSPSIFAQMEIDVLEFAVELSIKHSSKGALEMVKRLVNIVQDENAYCMYLKCLFIENERPARIREVFETAKSKISLSSMAVQYFESKIKQLEESEAAARKREEDRRERENEQRNRYGSMGGGMSPKAGEDFLGYYKTLGVKKSTPENKIKKQYKKIIREASRIKDKDKRSEKMKKVNKAWEILSDSKRKQFYDMGLDPENPQQPQGHHPGFFNGGENHAGFRFDGPEMDDILASFFGGGGRRDSRSHFRTNGRTYTFSSFDW